MRLVELKAAHGVMDKEEAEKIRQHILMAKDPMKRMEDAPVIDDSLKKEIFALNRFDSLCGKQDLEWPVKRWKLNLPNLFKLIFT
jgi:hypothetical protein